MRFYPAMQFTTQTSNAGISFHGNIVMSESVLPLMPKVNIIAIIHRFFTAELILAFPYKIIYPKFMQVLKDDDVILRPYFTLY